MADPIVEFSSADREAAETLIRLGFEEDLADVGDLTCDALIDEGLEAEIDVVAREPGFLAGAVVGQLVFAHLDSDVSWRSHVRDGEPIEAGTVLATVSGRVRSLLVGERTALNFLGHLSGIATLAGRFVAATTGTRAVVLDTRKTLPGYRRLHKYAVRCGGGTNHRMGLFDGVLIKDNHLAARRAGRGVAAADADLGVGEAVRRARSVHPNAGIEVEVDSLEQFEEAIVDVPDIILLDNFTLADLRTAVARRDAVAEAVKLEASGGVTLETVGDIARTGVDRISVGALTHSAPNVDIGFDWSGLAT